MKKTVLATFLIFLFSFSTSLLAFDHSHEKWNQVLKKYQSKEGLMAYKKLLKSGTKSVFFQYLKELKQTNKKTYDKFNKHQKMAFLINAYNAFTVKLIIDHYPVKSIKDIGGIFSSPWSKDFFKLLDGSITSIDPIEHKWLRPKFKDYRIHAAVNCASISCPPLRNEAFVANRLDQQLDEQMQLWLADKTRNQYDAKKGTLKISKIFDWYESDFKKWGQGVKATIAKFGPPHAKKALKKKGTIDYLDYDWNLNDSEE